jgi:hypothetical protein
MITVTATLAPRVFLSSDEPIPGPANPPLTARSANPYRSIRPQLSIGEPQPAKSGPYTVGRATLNR